MSIIIKSLSYVHPDKELLFEHLGLTVLKGDKVALVGNNGAGKSTLLQIIAGKLSTSSGEVLLSGKSWYVPQHLGQFDNMPVSEALGLYKKLTALQAITLLLISHDRYFINDTGINTALMVQKLNKSKNNKICH